MSQDTIKAVIVDDEELARRVIREHLSGFADIELVGECENGFDAVKVITEKEPDLVFLDVQMPKLNGFEVLELVHGSFAVVFVTAHEEHALKAFDVNAIDYLLKPFGMERFQRAVQKAVDVVRAGEGSAVQERLRKVTDEEKASDRILIRDGTNVHILPLGSVSHIEAEDDYVAVVSKGKRYLKQQSLTDMEAHLPSARFVRIHRSTILNIDYLSRIEAYAKDSRIAILNDGTRLTISRSGYDRLKQHLDG